MRKCGDNDVSLLQLQNHPLCKYKLSQCQVKDPTTENQVQQNLFLQFRIRDVYEIKYAYLNLDIERLWIMLPLSYIAYIFRKWISQGIYSNRQIFG